MTPTTPLEGMVELPPEPFAADCDEYYGGPPVERAWYWPTVEKMMREFGLRCYEAGRAAERERCAKLAETGIDTPHPTEAGIIMKNFGPAKHIAAAIRKPD